MNDGHVEDARLLSDEESMAATIKMRAKLSSSGLKDVNRQTMVSIADRLIALIQEGTPHPSRRLHGDRYRHLFRPGGL